MHLHRNRYRNQRYTNIRDFRKIQPCSAALIEAGGSIIDAPGIDQSGFAHLAQFAALAGRNAQEAFSQMEWE